MQSDKKYPFKYFNAYERDDKDFYFGRNDEVQQLYEMTFQTDLLLVYGAAGTGKTSLIQCGLANRFESSDWLALTINGGTNINQSFEKIPGDAIGNDSKLIYLIFDRFEDLYILGEKREQHEFYKNIKRLLALNQSVKIIISIREEYLGHLYDFEQVVPNILRKKLRIEPMTFDKVREVLMGINNSPKSLVKLQKGEEESFIHAVFEKLRDGKISIDLPRLQLLLNKLYLSLTNNDEKYNTKAVFSCAALAKIGNVGDMPVSQKPTHEDDRSDQSFEEQEIIEKQKRKARRNTRFAILVAAFFLLLGGWQWMEANRAKQKSKQEYQRAQIEYRRAEKLISAFYFYDGKFALAYKNNRFYFIDKEGNEVEKLGNWKKAEQFNNEYNGFAKVVDWDETIYLLDTLGNRFKYSDNIISIDSTIQALDVSGQIPLKLPKEIEKLTNLSKLWLYHNEITSLPPEIGNLTNLTWLYLHSNNLKSLPPEIGNLSNLTWLDLSENKITNLPPEIGNLTNLPGLNLSNNAITNLPPEIGNLRKLTRLDLFENKITNLPPEIGNLTNLSGFDLSNNALTSLPPEIGKLTNLSGLSLHSNRITSLLPEIGNLKNLMFLDLSDNKITCLPSDIGKLTNLVWLYLSDNEISNLPEDIGKLSNLSGLSLSGNKFTNLPPEIGNLTNLTWLILSDNKITSLPPEIGNLTNLTGLDLSDNKITSLPPEIENLPHLRTINCENNPLDNISKNMVEKINNGGK